MSRTSYVSLCSTDRFPFYLEKASATARRAAVSIETIHREIRDHEMAEEQGVWRFGKGRRGIRINPFLYFWHRRLKTLRADPVADQRIYEVTGFLLPFLSALKVALDSVIEQLIAARSATAVRIHQADKYSANGKPPEA